MNKKPVLLLVPIILILSACTIHLPYDMDPGYDFSTYRITFQVEPDDAHILVDGRFVGEAYEFALAESALKLSGRRHEIVVKREGYREEVVDIRDYDTRRFTVRLRLRPDASAGTGPTPPPPPQVPEKPAPTTVAPKPMPPTVKPSEEVDPPQVLAVPVHLTIQPGESAIYLEGDFWGISPQSGKIDNLRLRPGKYTLEVVHPGYMAVKKVFEVKEKTVEIVISLKKK